MTWGQKMYTKKQEQELLQQLIVTSIRIKNEAHYVPLEATANDRFQ